ncbi:ABC transporter permease [Shewanella maritima]|uniref:ABC transporter permease n=1 Tax=Shewanella maritima TaxID=2520507 RepID=UPI003736CE2E
MELLQTPSRLQAIGIIAEKELKDSIRNRWLIVIFGLFSLMTLSVSFTGSVVTGSVAIPPLNSVITSLSTLAVFVIPLAAIMLSYDAFVGEQESGTMLLLMSLPIERIDILFGKLLTHAGLLVAAISFSFGTCASLLMLFTDSYQFQATVIAFGGLIFSSATLAITYVLFSYFASLMFAEKARVIAALLSLWFVFVMLFDLLLLTLLVADLGENIQFLVNVLVLINPTDVFRAINLMFVEQGIGAFHGISLLSWPVELMMLIACAWPMLLILLLDKRINHHVVG